jgi:hypothetical protein
VTELVQGSWECVVAVEELKQEIAVSKRSSTAVTSRSSSSGRNTRTSGQTVSLRSTEVYRKSAYEDLTRDLKALL